MLRKLKKVIINFLSFKRYKFKFNLILLLYE